MRVIAGSARRILIDAPESKVRPTTDRTKETLFNMINSYLVGAKVLDLFAGSGALGIEALSRGSESCIFCDHYKESIRCIQNNLKKTKLIEKAEVFQYDYVKACQYLGNNKQTFDVIFLDPPYNKGYESEALILIKKFKLLTQEGVILIESSIETELKLVEEQGFEVFKIKKYKTNKFTFVRRKGE